MKEIELSKIAAEINKCRECKRGKSGKAVVGEGNPSAQIMFIGEAPGRKEAKIGRPFIGRSGKILRSFIISIGTKEEDVYITSPVKYLPNRGTPLPSDIVHGMTHLQKQIDVIDPRIIVLLGRVATLGVLGEKRAVLKEHGSIVEKNGRTYFLTLHPSAALRFVKFKKLLEEDFLTLKTLVKKI